MKKLSSILVSLTALVILTSSSCNKPDPTPPAVTYTVTFNLNGGSGTLANQTVASGTAITLPNSSASTFFFTGYTFAGWNTAANGSGTSYAAGSSYTVSGNVTLYAIWQNATSYTVTYNLNGGTGVANPATVLAGSSTILPSSSASTFYFTNYNFVNWNTAANGSGTSYLAGASYTPTGNVTLYAIWQPMYTAVFTATDASGSALLKAIPNNSVVKSFVVNVTTAGTAKLETIGTMTNGNNAIAYYWITSRDSAEVFQATSTLNPILAKTSALSSQTINLPLGVNVICFKTAAYAGGITNGSSIGLKLTGASTTVSNANYTADATTPNQAGSAKVIFFLANNTVISPNIQNTGGVYAYFKVFPYSDQGAMTYDGSLYPSISSISLDTRNTSWFTGTFTGYSALDFTNASGPAGRNFSLAQDNLGATNLIFTNAQFVYNSGILQSFSSSSGVKLVKSILGNYSYCFTGANVYNPTSSQVGPANICWYLKSIKFVGNPELSIYDPSGNRIW
jgi:uncharacterized repeat protein (TIGR02543 family)